MLIYIYRHIGGFRMVHKFINNLFEIDKSISELIKKGLIFSMVVCIIALFIFYFYHINFLNYIYHDISLVLLRTGITFAIGFFVCGVATNKISKDF